jgi:integrase
MPKLTRRPPSYTLHKPSGQARVRHRGQDYYLGEYGSRESREAYARLIAQISRGVPAPTPEPSTAGPTVAEGILLYWPVAQRYYRRADGTATGESTVIRAALKPLRRLYGATPAAEFKAKDLRLLQAEMVRLGWSRGYVNRQVSRVKRFFVWLAAEDLIPESVPGALRLVRGLAKVRSAAREKAPVGPVADEVVEKTLPHMSAPMAAIVRALRLSGCRVGELLDLTADQVDRADPACWVYTPRRHKSAHRAKTRTIVFGPRAVEVLNPYLVAAGGGPLFTYLRNSVTRAVRKACKRAGVPHWHPHQLRHSVGTELRARYGLETAQVVLGHAAATTTEIYAAPDPARARDVMAAVG